MQGLATTPLRTAALAGAFAIALLGTAAALFAAPAPAGYGPKLKPGLKSKRVISSQTFSITGVDKPQRYQVYCPRGTRPLGGGMSSSPQPDGAGAGAFPVSYERLGQQEGWHISAAQVGRAGTTSVTAQVLCRRYKGDIDPEEKFIKSRTYKNVGPGETKRFTRTCPHGKQLITGGYISSHFFSSKGVYVTESRMSGARSWTVLAAGVAGGKGGQVSAIAYCVKTKKRLLTEVASVPVNVSPGRPASTTTPGCPPGKQLIAGGYSAPPALRVFEGAFEGYGNWTAGAASYTGSGQITAFGYCL